MPKSKESNGEKKSVPYPNLQDSDQYGKTSRNSKHDEISSPWEQILAFIKAKIRTIRDQQLGFGEKGKRGELTGSGGAAFEASEEAIDVVLVIGRHRRRWIHGGRRSIDGDDRRSSWPFSFSFAMKSAGKLKMRLLCWWTWAFLGFKSIKLIININYNYYFLKKNYFF